MAGSKRQDILEAARSMVQAHGYNALSFRDVAARIGIKSASIHYHFPTKGDLAEALARDYTDAGAALLAQVPGGAPAERIDALIAIFRAALADDNRMCLVGIMAAEYEDLPGAARSQVARFSDVCVDWIADVLGEAGGADGSTSSARSRAFAIFSAVQGAQLVARGRGDLELFDRLIASYRETALIP